MFAGYLFLFFIITDSCHAMACFAGCHYLVQDESWQWPQRSLCCIVILGMLIAVAIILGLWSLKSHIWSVQKQAGRLIITNEEKMETEAGIWIKLVVKLARSTWPQVQMTLDTCNFWVQRLIVATWNPQKPRVSSDSSSSASSPPSPWSPTAAGASQHPPTPTKAAARLDKNWDRDQGVFFIKYTF